MNGRELDDPEATSDRWKLERVVVSDALADERSPDGRPHAHVAFFKLDGVAKHEAVRLVRFRLLILDDDTRSEPNLVGRDLRDVDLRQLAQALAELSQAGLNELLALEGGLVF